MIFVLLTVAVYKIIILAVPPSHTPIADTHAMKNVMSDITCTTATTLTKPNSNLNLKTSNTPLKLRRLAKWSTSQTRRHFASRRVFWCSICSKCGHTHTDHLYWIMGAMPSCQACTGWTLNWAIFSFDRSSQSLFPSHIWIWTYIISMKQMCDAKLPSYCESNGNYVNVRCNFNWTDTESKDLRKTNEHD